MRLSSEYYRATTYFRGRDCAERLEHWDGTPFAWWQEVSAAALAPALLLLALVFEALAPRPDR